MPKKKKATTNWLNKLLVSYARIASIFAVSGWLPAKASVDVSQQAGHMSFDINTLLTANHAVEPRAIPANNILVETAMALDDPRYLDLAVFEQGLTILPSLWQPVIKQKKRRLFNVLLKDQDFITFLESTAIVTSALNYENDVIAFLNTYNIKPNMQAMMNLFSGWLGLVQKSDADRNQLQRHQHVAEELVRFFQLANLADGRFSLMMHAINTQHKEAVKLLLKHNYDMYQSPYGIESNLVYSVFRNNNFDMFSLFLTYGFSLQRAQGRDLSIDTFYENLFGKVMQLKLFKSIEDPVYDFLNDLWRSKQGQRFLEEIKGHPEGRALVLQLDSELYAINSPILYSLVREDFYLQNYYWLLLLLTLLTGLSISVSRNINKQEKIKKANPLDKIRTRVIASKPPTTVYLRFKSLSMHLVSFMANAMPEHHPKTTTIAEAFDMNVVRKHITQNTQKIVKRINKKNQAKKQDIKFFTAKQSFKKVKSVVVYGREDDSPQKSPDNIEIKELSQVVEESKKYYKLFTQPGHELYSQLTTPLPADLFNVLQQLIKAGYRAFVVGGLVRDLMANKCGDLTDYDIVTDAPVSIVEKLFAATANPHRSDLVAFKHKGMSYDVSCVSNLDEQGRYKNALTRDFTINALYADLNGRVYDPTGRGLKDLNDKAGQLKTVLVPEACFGMDIKRLFRYLKFINKGYIGYYDPNHIRSLFAMFQKEIQEITLKAKNETNIDLKVLLLEQKSQYHEEIHLSLYKLFTSSDAVLSYQLLNKYGFIECFYPNLFKVDEKTQAWINQSFTDFSHTIKANKSYKEISRGIYAILAAAMVEDWSSDLKLIRTNNLFPPQLVFDNLWEEEALRLSHKKNSYLTSINTKSSTLVESQSGVTTPTLQLG